MIRKVVLRNFKRFKDVTFDLPGHIVVAGPNNTGKTTLLQAIAAWNLAISHWALSEGKLGTPGDYKKVPITRQAFLTVPLRSFDLLWTDQKYSNDIQIEVHLDNGVRSIVEFSRDTTEQMYVRPLAVSKKYGVLLVPPSVVFVPPISGVGLNEPLYANPQTVDAFLAQFKAGDVLRNLMVEASQKEEAWGSIQDAIHRLFGYELLVPESKGAFIVADYRERPAGPSFDITCAGSGFQQVLMLLCFLHTRPGAVLLLNEPDAHLHVILQDAVYDELRSVAAKKHAQLVIATHSEVIVNAADLSELRLSFDPSHALIEEKDRIRLRHSLRHLSNLDVMQAKIAPGILYLEGYTDLEILRAWARTLEHPAYTVLVPKLFWKQAVIETGEGPGSIPAKEHYEALRLVRPDLPGVILVDGDARPEIAETPITGHGLQRLRWRRYEIESYLLHPAAIARFVEMQIGKDAAREHLSALRSHFETRFPPAFVRDPLTDDPLVSGAKARTELLPQLLTAAGLPGFPYTRYHEIAAVMKPEEIHPEVREKLDLLTKAFGTKS